MEQARPPQQTRILIVVDSLLPGGAERLAVEAACALDTSRWAPHVLVTRCGGPLQSLLEQAGVPFTVLDRRRSVSLRATMRAVRLARSSDLIHSHKFGSNVWAAGLARLCRIPLVAHEHNWAGEPSRLRSWLDRRWVGRAASEILCVSQGVADDLRASGVAQERLSVLANGVRLQAAWPRSAARHELGLLEDAFVIGIVARLRPEKAHETLLRAAAQLHAAGRRPYVCAVGDGPRQQELSALARELGIEQYVVWSGLRSDAARLAGAFDVSVLTSQWEGLPLAALEAMAAGVPLVATAVGGLVPLLEGEAGRLIAPGDTAGLAGTLAELIDNPVLGRELGLAGQQRVRERFSFERMMDGIEDSYTRALGHTPASAAPNRSEAAA